MNGLLTRLGCVDISHLSTVIRSEARILKSVNGVCATILDSSLRCAAFRMTGGRVLRLEWRYGDGCVQMSLVIRSETRYLKSVNGVCAVF